MSPPRLKCAVHIDHVGISTDPIPDLGFSQPKLLASFKNYDLMESMRQLLSPKSPFFSFRRQITHISIHFYDLPAMANAK